jgi:periplasmic protein TonB
LPKKPASPKTPTPAAAAKVPATPAAPAAPVDARARAAKKPAAPRARKPATAPRSATPPVPSKPASPATPTSAPRTTRRKPAVRPAPPPLTRPPPVLTPALLATRPRSPRAAAMAIPKFGGNDPQMRLLSYAVGISIVVHAVLLAVRFAPFDLKEILDRGQSLEVALVNAKSATKPTKADILAQANLDGGGNTDADRRAKTPLPVLPKDSADSQISVATQQVERLQQQTDTLLTQLRSAPMAPAAPAPTEQTEKSELPTSTELMQRTLEAMRLEAQIAKDMDAYQKRPKRQFVGARAKEYRFARYVEDWRLKIERVGNLNYPAAARELKLYGNMIITVSIRSDGSVENIEVDRSSGQRVLDAAAVKIVQMAAPYAPFPPDIRRDTDILHITRTWSFTPADELRSE